MGAGPQPCGSGAARGFARRHLASEGGGTSAQPVALLDTLGRRCLACSTWAWARGVPASGRHDALSRARTATGWGTPCLKIVVLMVFAPLDEGDEPPPCLLGPRRSERRSANIDDAALVEECVETWEGGAATRGQEGNVSSPLRGHHPSVASYAFCPFACVLMSGTLAFLRHHDNLFGSR